MANEPEPIPWSSEQLAEARRVARALADLPKGPTSLHLLKIAGSISNDLAAKEEQAQKDEDRDQGWTVEELIGPAQIISFYSQQDPDAHEILGPDISSLFQEQMRFALKRRRQEAAPKLLVNSPFRRSFYFSGSHACHDEPTLTYRPKVLGGEAKPAFSGETVRYQAQKLSFSDISPSDKAFSLDKFGDTLGLIFTGLSPELVQEVSMLGYVNKEVLRPNSDIREGLPGVIANFAEATLPGTRQAGIVGGTYEPYHYKGSGTSRKNYREIVQYTAQVVRQTCQVEPVVLLGPDIYSNPEGTHVFYLTGERRAILIRQKPDNRFAEDFIAATAEFNASFPAYQLRDMERKWRPLRRVLAEKMDVRSWFDRR